MENKSALFNLILNLLITAFLFLFPLFFLPVTREFLVYSKFYFLIFFALVVFFVSLSKFVLTKKFNWSSNPAVQPFVLIILSYVLSIVLASPNKMQAIFRPQYGLVMIVGMMVFYLYASYFFKKMKMSPVLVIGGSAVLSGLFAMIMLVDPLKNVNLPGYFGFLKNTSFNTVGSPIDLLSFLFFALVGVGLYMWRMKKSGHNHEDSKTTMVILSVMTGAIVVSILFSIYSIVQSILTDGAQVILPPLNLSWYAVLEMLKNPLTAVFGIGVDNFSVMFTRVRNINYNLTSLWQVNTFSTSRSALMHLITELGLFGSIGFGLLIVNFWRKLGKVKAETAGLFVASLIILLLLPPSIMSFFMFFVSLALIVSDVAHTDRHEEYEVDLSKMIAPHIGLAVLGFLFIGSTVYFLGRNFLSEIYFKRSIDAITANSLQDLYSNQQRAVQYNPYNEEFRRNFSQTNLVVANNIAAKGAQQITDRDRQTIAQTLQISISEAKSAVALNPGRVTNWQNLATVYRQIINAVQQAPIWTISSYQQAILLDSFNPVLRLELGSVYYLLQQYDQAQRLFEQTVSLKPDWANAHYNLAWAYYQKGLYQNAVDQMQVVVELINPADAEADYKKAQSDLEVMKDKLAEASQTGATTGDTTEAKPKELNLPTPPSTATVEPRIQLPSESSPEKAN
jgi:tetratricopeptide (TPR) repeat protein